MNKFLKSGCLVAVAALGLSANPSALLAQGFSSPIYQGAATGAPLIAVEVNNIQRTGSGGAAPTLTFDLYLSADPAYVSYVAANGAGNGMQNVDVGFDVDLGTDGTTTVSNPPLVTSVVPLLATTGNGVGMLSSASGTNSLAGGNPTGYESKFKFNLVRLNGVSLPLSSTPTMVLSATVTLPAGTVIGTTGMGGANIRLRSGALAGAGSPATTYGPNNTATSSNIAGVGLAGSKWSDFNGNTQNIIGPSSNATGIQPLAVQLLDFTAVKASDNERVQLDWKTATETGADYFEVERSSSEGGDYSSIGVRVKATGTTSVEHSYLTYDRSPLTGANWYRLRVVDLSGKWGYSDKRMVRFDGGVKSSESVSFYPNPVTRLDVDHSGLKVKVSVAQSLSYTISDGSGKLVGGGSVEVKGGEDSYELSGSLSGLSAGTYYVNVKGATVNATLKIAKTE